MSFAIGAGLLTLCAVAVVLWRLRFQPALGTESDEELQRGLFVEKLDQLRFQRDGGDITFDQYAALKLEYERQFLIEADRLNGEQGVSTVSGRWLPLATAMLIPFIAAVLYSQLGAFDELSLRRALEQRSEMIMSQSPDSIQLDQLNAKVIDGLSRLSQKHSEEPLYPVLMAQLHVTQGSYDLAVGAYQRAVALLPDNGEIRAEYAQALFFAANNRATDEMEKQAGSALKHDPDNQTALGLMGIASFHREQYQEAIRYWQQALALLPAASPSRHSLESGIAAARARLGDDVTQTTPEDKQITVNVSAPDVALPPETTVFVYARQWQGSPMPLAIQRLTLADLPISVELSDAMAMNPAARLSSVDKVQLVARISVSGSPAPASGDWQALSDAVDLADSKVEFNLVIDRQIP
jgi:cytochrome c-type biogenesis protein CcmH